MPARLLIQLGVMAMASITSGIAFWYPVEKAQRQHIKRITSFAVQAVQTDISDELGFHLQAQVQLAEICGIEDRLSSQEWNSYVAPFMAQRSEYLAVLMTDNAYTVRFSFAGHDAAPYVDALLASGGPLKGVPDAHFDQRQVKVIPVLPAHNGRAGHAILTPVPPLNLHKGFIVAIFDDERFLQKVLTDHDGKGYGLTVSENNRELYRSPSTNTREEVRWAQDAQLSISSATWHVRAWPQLDLLGEIEPRSSMLALLIGAAIGMLLSTTLFFAGAASLKSRALIRARDELDTRVQDRTAELDSLNKRLRAEVYERSQAEQSLQALSGRLLQLRDEEQRRIARELHDSTGQIVGALTISLDRLQAALIKGNVTKAQVFAAQSSDLADRATSDLRTISHLLHPPILDELGLYGAVQWYAAGFSDRCGITVDLEIQPDLRRLPRELELTIFRILQEALTNIYKHSGSPTAGVKLFTDDCGVTLNISDRGCGFSPATLGSSDLSHAVIGVGTAGMRERVRQLKGQIIIDSDSTGTRINVVLPIASTAIPQSDADCDFVAAC